MSPQDELTALMAKLIDGRLGGDEEQRLRELLTTDDEAARAYVRYMTVHAMLRWRFATPGQSASDSGGPFNLAADAPTGHAEMDAAMVPSPEALNEQDAVHGLRLRPDDAADETEPLPASIPMQQAASSSRRLVWWMAAAAAVLIAGSIAIMLTWRGGGQPDRTANVPVAPVRPTTKPFEVIPPPPSATRPQSVVVATFNGSVHAEWGDGVSIEAGAPVIAGRHFELSKGLVELAFANGARVIVEGPASFAADSPNGMTLRAGRLAATVPEPARGFAVRTPGANVVDLGTEFGVAIDAATGATEVQVFAGEVQAAPDAGRAIAAKSTPLKAGDAGRVTPTGVSVEHDAASPQAFVRHLSTDAASLDLADLISGGDGTQRRRARGIIARPKSGTPGHAYRTVPNLTVVDGVFVPGGDTPIDSTGRTFAFPATDGESDNRIWAGGTGPGQDEKDYAQRSAIMDGVNYAAPGHTLLFMNTNVGVTFDLAGVRRLYPGRSATRFRCVVGNTHPPGRDRLCETFVLVDGVERARHRWRGQGEPAATIDVPLTAADRFVTLAATDGGDTTEWDWLVWGDPTFDLAPAGPTPGRN